MTLAQDALVDSETLSWTSPVTCLESQFRRQAIQIAVKTPDKSPDAFR